VHGLLALFLMRRLRGMVRIAAGALALLGVGSLCLSRVYPRRRLTSPTKQEAP